jgi:hypothetical protein
MAHIKGITAFITYRSIRVYGRHRFISDISIDILSIKELKGKRMALQDTEFETGRMDNYKRDFYINSHAWAEDPEIRSYPVPKRFEYTNSTETTETGEGFVFRIPLSEVSMENLKILPEESYIIVQSDRKTIFISLDRKIDAKTLTTRVNGDMLTISAKKRCEDENNSIQRDRET